MVKIIQTLLLSLSLAGLVAGCTTKREVYAGHDPDQVWTAMLAVAQTPDYARGDIGDRWTVRENRVWVDPQTNRIEVFRRVERVLYQPASRPVHQDRTWKFQIALEEHDPPTAMFRTRNVGVPAHGWDEAERYFNEVWDVLGGRPAEPQVKSTRNRPGFDAESTPRENG